MLRQRAAALDAQQKALADRDAGLADRAAYIARREKELATGEASLRTRMDTMGKIERELAGKRDELDAIRRRLGELLGGG